MAEEKIAFEETDDVLKVNTNSLNKQAAVFATNGKC